MTFDQLKLLCAVRKANLGSGDPVSDQRRMEWARTVFETYTELFQTVRFPFEVDDVMQVFYSQRKNANTQTKADIALTHGVECFWRNRGKGPCCDNAEAGHLIPNCEDGPLTVENCVIECRAHNNQRRAMHIEQYLQSDKATTEQ